MTKSWPRALFLGIASSVFFSVTYVVNSAMAQSGGDWLWSASLRYLFMLPILLVLTAKSGWAPVWQEIRRAPGKWVLWSLIGFGAFYAPMTFASAYGPGWMVAGTFQFTSFAGALETPLFRDENGARRRIPVRLFPAFAIIIFGVFLLQLEQMRLEADLARALLFSVPVLISAFAYPLGNRKTMELCENRLNTMQRVLAMTVCSLPLWLLMAAIGTLRSGFPPAAQLARGLAVAVFSGVTATVVFFKATSLVRTQPQRLALVESTQCGEVIFSLIGGILLLGEAWPGSFGWLGLVLIVGGMIINSLLASHSR